MIKKLDACRVDMPAVDVYNEESYLKLEAVWLDESRFIVIENGLSAYEMTDCLDLHDAIRKYLKLCEE